MTSVCFKVPILIGILSFSSSVWAFPAEDNTLANFLWGVTNYGLFFLGGIVAVYGFVKFVFGLLSTDPRKIGFGAIALIGGFGIMGAKAVAKWAYEKWWEDQVDHEVYWGDETAGTGDPRLDFILKHRIPTDGVYWIDPGDVCKRPPESQVAKRVMPATWPEQVDPDLGLKGCIPPPLKMPDHEPSRWEHLA